MRRLSTTTRRNVAKARGGFVLIVAMISFLAVSAVLVSTLGLATAGRKQLRYERLQLQAAWLAESGVERAAYRLKNDPKFTGEVWNLTAAELGGNAAGLVEIRVAVPEDAPDTRTITVVATYPTDAVRFATRSKQIRITVKPQS